MKGDFVLLGTVAAAMLAIPAAAMLWAGQPLVGVAAPPESGVSQVAGAPSSGTGTQKPSTGLSTPDSVSSRSQAQSGSQVGAPEVKAAYKTDITAFKIKDETTGDINVVPVEEYVLYAMASEMPADFHMEALKAQGVAALSYAMYRTELQRSSPDPALGGADFSADPQNRKVYMTEEGAREFYGDQFEYSWARLTEAAQAVRDLVLVYEDQPIAAAYHAISSGLTEASENIWGSPLPYLTTSDSQWDILAPGYKSTATYTKEEMRALLTGAGATLPHEAARWITVLERSPAGYVTKVQVGDQEMTGSQLRFLLDLRSSDFEMIPSGDNFVFEVKGYGHGAGLSQNGADYLGRQGKTFQQILAHYYAGATLARLENVGGAP